MGKKWSISDARRHFSDLLHAAASEPQEVYNRNRKVAAVIGGGQLDAFSEWRERQAGRSLADAFAELRPLLGDEEGVCEPAKRADRANPFVEVLDELPG